MAKSILRTGKKTRPKTAIKGKRFRCATCRKRSPRPVKILAPWYCPNCRNPEDLPVVAKQVYPVCPGEHRVVREVQCGWLRPETPADLEGGPQGSRHLVLPGVRRVSQARLRKTLNGGGRPDNL